MLLLNIIDKIYESNNFKTILIAAIILLVLLFIIVLIIGIRDSKKSKEPKVINEEDVKDITFDMPKEMENIKEDVTFEMPVLTKNLEEFKKNLEEKIEEEEKIEVRRTNGLSETKEIKPLKILDANEIEDTAIVNLNEVKEENMKSLHKPEDNKKKTHDTVYDLDDDF